MPPDRPAILAAMEAAAIEAGAAILSVRDAGIVPREKADCSPVTEADEAAEIMILAVLARAAPDVSVVAEEQCARVGIPACPGSFFLVDPLDGTREFVAGHPHYTVNVALVEAGRPTLGVVVAPALSRLWVGDVAAGEAWTRELPDGPPRSIHARPRVAETIALVSRCNDCAETAAWLAGERITDVRRIGSSLKLCLIAEGEADLYPRHGPTSAWDIAAGQAVLEAAGGRVIGPDGASLRYADPREPNPHFVASGAFDPPPP